MSLNINYRTRICSDAKVIENFEEIVEDLQRKPADGRVILHFLGTSPTSSGPTNVGMTEFNLSEIEDHSVVRYSKEHDNAIWSEVSLYIEPIQLTIRIERYFRLEAIKQEKRNEDTVTITHGSRKNELEPNDLLMGSKAISTVQKYFIPFDQAAAIEQSLGPEMAEFYNLREEGLRRLEDLSQRIAKETHDYRQQLDSELRVKEEKLNTEFDVRKENLDKQIEEHREKLREQESQLEKRRQELDDRSVRHARREQSRNLQKKIAARSEKFTLTPETEAKRQPIRRAFLVLMIMSIVLIVFSQVYPIRATEGLAFWFEIIRFPAGLLGFASSVIFYIRWNDHWFRQHADQELRLHQLALDVDRAGYVTEMLLEWQDDKGVAMPELMVERLTTGLFVDQITKGAVQHPLEDIIKAMQKSD